MILDIIRKEIKEIIKTRRLLVIGILYTVAIIAWAVVSGHLLERGPNEMISSNLFILMFVSLLTLILAYDTIVGERSRGSLSLVFSKPVGRVQIFAGKFLSIFLFSGVIFLVVSSFGYWLNAVISGEFPSGTEVAAAYKLIFTVLLVIVCWISFAMLFSTLFKSSAISLVTTLILWIMVLPLVSQIPVAIHLMGQVGQGVHPGPQFEPGFEEVVFPGWVKAFYAVNPDNCISQLSGILLSGISPFGPILAIWQCILAMFIFLGVFSPLASCFSAG